ncbi:MAG: RNA polymerase sigma factor [Oscillospiraceae bacterium]|nr:RNA polymerase sigma factor [Oscillospiraceae bacterium]
MTDAEFEAAVEQIRSGDKQGLRAVYDAYGDRMYRFFLSRVHHHQDAQDLTSEYFLKLWECLPGYRKGTGHRSWLTVIARNMATDHLRRASREMPDDEIESSPALTQSESAEDTVISEMSMTALLERLTLDEQEIVRLHIAAQLTFREIAAVLGRPLGTVAWKYRNAIGKLQKAVKEGSPV